ncbi:uncharacterized protein LOC124445109 [Xenia sp. Carnegie-2017]|uniref:uncharacterized protein LOC124445109 n=1 Tax=Xenia sp. Carnegie-2017 TaxID=2897299 RepID=UPI001F042DCC|nr:uncharacterized protein LOC124445109 [Xenia sp. Carnegie-2017]
MQGSAEELFEGESYMDYSSFEESSQSEDVEIDLLHYGVVQAAFAADDCKILAGFYVDLARQLNEQDEISLEQLLGAISSSSNSISRNYCAETYIPLAVRNQKEKSCIALRSEASGNCLYSSVSLSLLGDDRLVPTLRILTSLELFLNAHFYCEHPCFLSAIEEHPDFFKGSIKNLLPLSVSVESLDTSASKEYLVKKEAVFNCNDGKWSSFLCILGLSSVLKRCIVTYYPDCGQHRLKLLFNRVIQPRLHTTRVEKEIHILFCHEGDIRTGESFQPNHFVPLLFHASAHKRKSADITQATTSAKKRKVPSLFSKKVAKFPSGNIPIISNSFTASEKQPSKLFEKSPMKLFLLPNKFLLISR